MAAGREKKQICGPGEKIVVVHGRLPFPAPLVLNSSPLNQHFTVWDKLVADFLDVLP